MPTRPTNATSSTPSAKPATTRPSSAYNPNCSHNTRFNNGMGFGSSRASGSILAGFRLFKKRLSMPFCALS